MEIEKMDEKIFYKAVIASKSLGAPVLQKDYNAALKFFGIEKNTEANRAYELIKSK